MEVYDKAIDKGLEGVVACTTKISSIVGSTLCFRGYTIEDLAENSHFEEVIYLLWNDTLPSENELASFSKRLSSKMVLGSDFVDVLKKLPTDRIHPMAWLRTALSLTSFWNDEVDLSHLKNFNSLGEKLIAQTVCLIPIFERLRQGEEIVLPDFSKNLAWNFLYMLKGKAPSEKECDFFDTCLVLHADHELNCSSFSARVTTSSLSDVTSALVSAIGTLKGPLHGGANEQVMIMLKEIGTKDKVPFFVEKALKEKRKIMGFGHRVYKDGDPRMKILKKMSQEIAKETGNENYFEMSDLMEKLIFEKKGLLPNVDFYSATVYYSLGIPLDLYTPIFALSRLSGWLAHILEQYGANRIYRPRGKWLGQSDLKWKPVSQRV